jgi:hypothetical protein
VVLGPQRLPDAARKAGKMMSDLRQLSAGFQREVQQAFEEHGGASAVQAADKLKTITSGPMGPVRTGINAAVASVSSQARLKAPAEGDAVAPKGTPNRSAGSTAKNATRTTAKKTAKKAAPTKRGPAKKSSPAKKSVPAKKVPAAKKAPAKRAAPARKS